MEEKIIIRDRRKPKQFSVENLVIDEYLPFIGEIGFSLYSIYCRLANIKDERAFPSTITLSKFVGWSRTTINKYNKILVGCELIHIQPTKRTDGGDGSNEYFILDIESLTEENRKELIKVYEEVFKKVFPVDFKPLIKKHRVGGVSSKWTGGCPANGQGGVQQMDTNSTNNNNPKDNNNRDEVVVDFNDKTLGKKESEIMRVLTIEKITDLKKQELKKIIQKYHSSVLDEALKITVKDLVGGKVKTDSIRYLGGVCKNMFTEYLKKQQQKENREEKQIENAKILKESYKRIGFGNEEINKMLGNKFKRNIINQT